MTITATRSRLDNTGPGVGRRAVVTGGSDGIGLAIARELAAAGWRPTIVARDPQRLATAQAAAADHGLALATAAADVTDEAAVSALFARLAADGPLHLCVNNVGRNLPGLLVKAAADGTVRRYRAADWHEAVATSLTSVFLTGREAAAHMVDQGIRGVIVNISSAARRGAYGQSAYAAAKAGVDALTRTWAVELADHGIRVVGVSPGLVGTRAVRDRMAARPSYRSYLDRLTTAIPLARWAEAEEIARAVRFVTENDYITGTVLDIDGGGIPDRI